VKSDLFCPLPPAFVFKFTPPPPPSFPPMSPHMMPEPRADAAGPAAAGIVTDPRRVARSFEPPVAVAPPRFSLATTSRAFAGAGSWRGPLDARRGSDVGGGRGSACGGSVGGRCSVGGRGSVSDGGGGRGAEGSMTLASSTLPSALSPSPAPPSRSGESGGGPRSGSRAGGRGGGGPGAFGRRAVLTQRRRESDAGMHGMPGHARAMGASGRGLARVRGPAARAIEAAATYGFHPLRRGAAFPRPQAWSGSWFCFVFFF
jgi:hypothetical protein